MKGSGLYILLLSTALATSLPFCAKAQVNTEQITRVGVNALYFEDYMLSIQYFNRAIEAKPYLAKPYFYRAVAKLNLEDYEGAEKDATTALELNPFLTDAYEARGVSRQNMGDYKGAIADYDSALSQLPENRGLLFNKSLALSDCGENAEALQTLTELIESHPGFDAAYTGRAKVSLALNDTVAAIADLNEAIRINPSAANPRLLRADIMMHHGPDYESALRDLNEAIKLMPHLAASYINRAFIRYNLGDYFGAMEDYDYAIAISPVNAVAYFNRGLLRAEVSDNDKAVDDFTKVLELDPSNMRARYNRSLILREKNDYGNALQDLDEVISENPDIPGLHFEKSDLLMKIDNRNGAMHEYDLANEMLRQRKTHQQTNEAADNHENQSKSEHEPDNDLQNFSRRFTTLLTTVAETTDDNEFNNKSIRGKIQDRNVAVKPEDDFILSFYSSPTELSQSTYFMPQASKINESHQLDMLLQVTNRTPVYEDEDALNYHFKTVCRYDSILTDSATPRPIDYFARAMHQFTLRNYPAAIRDFTAAIALSPDFAIAYLMRAEAKLKNIPSEPTESILSDLNAAIELSPRSPFPHFNKGNLILSLGKTESAIAEYNKAIELKEDFGEAYFNRGYALLKIGNRDLGKADISRAGQLGIPGAYNLLKRIDTQLR